MSYAAETELKLALDAKSLAVLLADPAIFPAGARAQKQVSTYFDTPDEAFRKAGLTLRVRRTGQRRVQTLKAASDEATSLFVRPEWEHDIKGDVPEVDGLARMFTEALNGPDLSELRPVFATHVNRVRSVHVQDGSRIELVADKGSVRAGSKRSAICEIELELLEGERHALFTLARTIGGRVSIRLGLRSKSERGYALIRGDADSRAKADPVRLTRDMSVADAFAAIVAACLRHYRLNEDRLLGSADAEALHQCRVALRRLRSTLSIFRPCLDEAEADRFREELNWISGLFGAVRNVDVLMPRIDDAPVLQTLQAARKHHLAELVRALDSARLRNLLFDLVEYSEVGDWRDADIAALPARDFAQQALDRLRRRVKRRGRHLERLDEDDRHRLRIAGKKLRYTAEFFVSLFPGRKAGGRREDLLSALEKLQTKLGELNDFAVGRTLLAELGIANAGALLPQTSSRRVRKLLDRAVDCHETLIDAKPFWR